MAVLKFPGIVLPALENLKLAIGLVRKFRTLKTGTLFLCSEVSLNPFVVHGLFGRECLPASPELEFGLCMHCRDKNDVCLKSDLLTATELGIRYMFILEPDYKIGKAVNIESSLSLIEMTRKLHGKHFTILVENVFLNRHDLLLLEKQFAAGADLVVSSNPDAGNPLKKNYETRLINSRKTNLNQLLGLNRSDPGEFIHVID